MDIYLAIITFAWLNFAFAIKHFVVDFVLQNRYMLGKFNEKGWVLPLAAHAGEHVIATFLISTFFLLAFTTISTGTILIWAIGLSIFDFVTHFTMDRIKASPHIGGKYNHTQKQYWLMLGTDQTVHHVVHLIIATAIMVLMV